jgi:hypothetical protein
VKISFRTLDRQREHAHRDTANGGEVVGDGQALIGAVKLPRSQGPGRACFLWCHGARGGRRWGCVKYGARVILPTGCPSFRTGRLPE